MIGHENKLTGLFVNHTFTQVWNAQAAKRRLIWEHRAVGTGHSN